MSSREKEQHQPEPWRQDGRNILNRDGWTLAKTIFAADARRIVAAVNDVAGVPTAALEAGFVREVLAPAPRAGEQIRIETGSQPAAASTDAAESFLHDRRVAERRRADRRRSGVSDRRT
jgi:hypothetical protein